VLSGKEFGAFWNLCWFAVETYKVAKTETIGVGKAVFGYELMIE
jgi:hypothetical protein